MTPEQIEAAARLVCEKRGIPIDVETKYGHGVTGLFLEVYDEVKAHHEVITSIATVLDMDKK